MKRHIRKVFGGATMLGVAGLGVISGAVCSIVGGQSTASALSHAMNVGVSFEVDESITVSVPASGLVIDDLVPGTMADSNVIAVNVKCNSTYGYTLNATVGSSTYNTRNLVHSNSAVSDVFASVDYGASLATLEAVKTWGYAASTDSATTWTKYSGLPLYTDTANVATLRATTSGTAAAGDDTNFKIAAYAAAAMPLGEYNNVINFTAVANEPSVKYMQDVASWGSSVGTGEVVEAIDSRDNKTYYVTKLADGKLWMTQNLDFDLDTGTTLTPEDTDITANWTPSVATHTTGDTTWGGSKTTPESYDPGDLCWTGLVDTSWSGTLNNTSYVTNCAEDGANLHYHVGNYYNWTAAVAMNDSSSYSTDETDMNQSICPAGWTLPKGGNTLTGVGSFYFMINQTGFTAKASGNIHLSPAFFVYSGLWNGSSLYIGSYGLYWSSVVWSSDSAYALYLSANSGLNPQSYDNRGVGDSVRCVAR